MISPLQNPPEDVTLSNGWFGRAASCSHSIAQRMESLLLAARAGDAAVEAEGARGPAAASTPADPEALALLSQRFAALQLERKAAGETFDETLRYNSAIIRELRAQQRSLVEQLVGAQRRVQRERQSAARAIATGGEVLITDDSLVSAELVRHRSAFDVLRFKSSALRAQASALDADAAVHALALERDDAPLRARVRASELELERVIVQRMEEEAVGRAYAEIGERLRAERAGALVDVRRLEADLSAKAADAAELRGLEVEARRRMQAGLGRLLSAERAAGAERATRGVAAAARAAAAQGRLAATGTVLSRERARRDLLAEVAGDLGTSEEVALQVR